MRFKNVSPLGDLDIPAVGIIAAGEEFEVPEHLAEAFAGQASNYEPVDVDAKAVVTLLNFHPSEQPQEPAAPVDATDGEKAAAPQKGAQKR